MRQIAYLAVGSSLVVLTSNCAVAGERINDQKFDFELTIPDGFVATPAVVQGDVIYAVPRRFPGIARVVDRARLEAIPPFGREPDPDRLRAYAAVVEQGPDASADSASRAGASSRERGL